MEEEYEEIYTFLTTGETPPTMTHCQKYYFKKRVVKFSLRGGQVVFGTRRVVRSREEARRHFLEVHGSAFSHVGLNRTFSTMSRRWYWRGMYTDTANWIRHCDKCRKNGKRQVDPQPLESMKVSAVWELVVLDILGPLPQTEGGHHYLLTATDYFSKWVEAFPMKTASAAEVSRFICSMIYRHGCPKRILSDHSAEFVEEINDGISNLLGLERSVTAAYDPETRDLDEKTNLSVKRAISKLVSDQPTSWDLHLDATLFSLRSEVQATTKLSPFLLMYGREAIFPSEPPAALPVVVEMRTINNDQIQWSAAE